MTGKAFKIWTANDKDDFVTQVEPDTNRRVPAPGSEAAVNIYMSVIGTPSDFQAKLYEELSYVLDVVRRIYLPGGTHADPVQFRTYYVRIFRLAQVGLEGPDTASKQARSTLESIKSSLVDDEGSRVKTKNLLALSETALVICLALGIFYCVLMMSAQTSFENWLSTLQLSREPLANFLLFLIGCLAGICLSYGVRTSTLTLNDLVSAGPDRLPPPHRLVFVTALTLLFGLLLTNGIVEVKIGELSTADISTNPGLAFIVGAFFGLGEAALPGLAGKHAENFLKGLQ